MASLAIEVEEGRLRWFVFVTCLCEAGLDRIEGPEANSKNGAPNVHIEVVEGHFGTFAHNFCFILKHMTCFRAY